MSNSMYWDRYGYSVGQLTHELTTPSTIQIVGCEKIILKDKSLNFVFELSKGRIEDFDEITINGVTFKKVKGEDYV